MFIFLRKAQRKYVGAANQIRSVLCQVKFSKSARKSDCKSTRKGIRKSTRKVLFVKCS